MAIQKACAWNIMLLEIKFAQESKRNWERLKKKLIQYYTQKKGRGRMKTNQGRQTD